MTYRKELQEHKKEDPHFEVVHDAGTADGSRLHAPAIIADYPSFAQCRHICDIGGGLGSFLYSILKYYSFGIKATNFDLPDVIKNSEYVITNPDIHIYTHVYTHTCIHTWIHTCIHTWIRAWF